MSTGSVVSFTPDGTNQAAPTTASTARGRVMRNTDPHHQCSSTAPAVSGPIAAMAPPMPDQRAMARVRPGPDQRAAMSARVVG